MSGGFASDGRRNGENYQQYNGNTNLYMSRIGELPRNITESTLTTQQFYGNVKEVQRGQETSIYAPSEASHATFKAPNTVQKYNEWAKIESMMNNITNGFRCFEMDKFFLKLWVKVSSEILNMGTQRNQLILDRGAVIDMLCENIKTKYYQHTARPMSTMSSQASVMDTFGSVCSLPGLFNGTRSVAPAAAAPTVPAGNRSNLPSLFGDTSSAVSRSTTAPGPFDPGNQSTIYERNPTYQPHIFNAGFSGHQSMTLDQTVTNYDPQLITVQHQSIAPNRRTVVNMDNNQSQIPSDGVNGNTSTTFKKPLSPKKVRPVKRKTPVQTTKESQGKKTEAAVNTSQNMPLCKGTSRFGRQLKSPREFWRSNETVDNPVIDNSRSKSNKRTTPEVAVDLNESISLRNKKLVMKNTPVATNIKAISKRTLAVVLEELTPQTNKKKAASKKCTSNRRKPPLNANKENTPVQRDKAVSKALPKEKGEQKKDNTKEKKRKSKGSESLLTKRRKINEIPPSDLDSDSDELFEPIFPRKKTQASVTQVVTPNSGMRSVKKALVSTSNSKETPPAKLFSKIMDLDVAPVSAAKEHPKDTTLQVVNRVTKVMKRKSPKKNNKKAPKGKCEDPQVTKILDEATTKSTYYDNNGVVLEVFRGKECYEKDSDDSYLSEDDDLF